MSAAAASPMTMPAHAESPSSATIAALAPPSCAATPPAGSTLSLPLGKRGHKRSVSLENNAPLALRSTPNLGQSALGSPLLQFPHAAGQHFIPHTGTLKSRQEQRRLSQKFGSHSNLDDDGVAVGIGGGGGVGLGATSSQLRSKFQNIRQMFELSRSCVGEEALQSLPATLGLNQRRTTPIAVGSTGGSAIAAVGGSRLAINEPTLLGEPLEQNQSNGNFLRPIVFKPIPFEPDYRIQQQQQQQLQSQQHQQQQQQLQQQQQMYHQPAIVNGQAERYGYGSTPSLVPLPPAATQKFGSTTDLRHLAARRRNHRVTQRSGQEETPNLDCMGVRHDVNSKSNNAVNGSDLTPSPSDSGISELEAALKDRDSELSYLRQAMEHNEKDKEAYWENETQRLRLFYEGQQREYQLKFKKMEQLLALQQFQLKQHKLRQSEQVQKLQQQLEHARSSNQSLQNSALTMNQQLEEAHQTVASLRVQLEDSEWKVCERNGEIALLKTQLKEAHIDIHLKDHAIVSLKHSNNNNNIDNNSNSNCETSLCQSQPKEEPHQQQQLNKIIGLKNQVISALTNELAKLRKELSDLAIAHEYGEEPCGRYTRLKQQLDNLNDICQKTRKYSTVPNIGEGNDEHENEREKATTPQQYQQQTLDTLIEESTSYAEDIAKLRQKLDDFRINLELEKRQWCAEKDKVLGYQKQLQAHYINMYQKLRCLDNAGMDIAPCTVAVKSTNVN
ncbi:leucine zipper putative tumor suppressor 2 homolog isoform X2 [Drosophila willistoni]|uniref:leucine zipper putative tumor suppressor 2 homolog isoform X2 n=1 Tax=Drosophila willistoni TaxID=7260 RepID=UPI001F087930|nr:leucine zipper putative tumor suppressor 2 homolog isoform X2 [Drosophila willistoni]